ncbi:MAG: hypothetical protein U0166_13600 [Acidobacteriota bacterium]
MLGDIGRFFGSIFGAIGRVFRVGAGKVENASDAALAGSPDAIKATFRMTKDKWIKEYKELEAGVSQLILIREQKTTELEKTLEKMEKLSERMEGALALAEKEPGKQAAHGEAYARFQKEHAEASTRAEELKKEVEALTARAEDYKQQLSRFERDIRGLDEKQAEAVADIVSSQSVIRLNDQLKGFAQDRFSKDLQAIEAQRQKLKAQAKLSTELAGVQSAKQDADYEVAGKTSVGESDFAKKLAERKARTEEGRLTSEKQAAPPERDSPTKL